MVIKRSNNLFQALARILLLVFFFVLLFLLFYEGPINNKYLSVIVLILSVCEIITLISNRTVHNSGLLMIFFLYTLIVHNGFVIAYLFDENYIHFQSAASMAFVNNDFYNKAIIISNIVILAFVFSTEIVGKDLQNIDYRKETYSNDKNSGVVAANVVGLSGLAFGGIYLAYIVYSRGLWMQGYAASLSALENNSLYIHVVVLTSLSMALLMAAGTEKGIKIGLILYGIIAVLHFSMGNRGEVMYAAVVCFALYSIRFNRIKFRHILILGGLVVILIPLVRISRELKLDMYTLNPFTSLLDVLAEEGIEISPFTYTVQLVETKYGHAFGATYLNVFLEFLCRRFGSVSPLAIDRNIIKAIMPQEGMGYSMIAELYYNFGIWFACVIYMIFAWVIRKIDYRIYVGSISQNKKIFYSMLMVEMINLTRNDASTLPLYLVWTLILYGSFILLSNMLGRRKGYR